MSAEHRQQIRSQLKHEVQRNRISSLYIAADLEQFLVRYWGSSITNDSFVPEVNNEHVLSSEL